MRERRNGKLKGSTDRQILHGNSENLREIFARSLRAKFWNERPEGFITHARALFLGSIAHGEEKGGRRAGGGGREKGSRNEREKKKERKKDRYRAPWNFTNERSQLT